jgi:hypothetical protein
MLSKDAERALKLDHKNAKAQEYALMLRLSKGNGKIDQKQIQSEQRSTSSIKINW